MELHGRIKKVRFSKPGWMVAEIECPGETVTAVGSFDHCREGEAVILKGDYTLHPKFGEQFRVKHAESKIPKDAQGVIAFLSKLAMVGNHTARLMVDHFGHDAVFDVIENEPHKLLEVRGIAETTMHAVIESYRYYREDRERLVKFKKLGMTDWQIAKVVEKYSHDAERVVAELPYDMTTIRGFGFKTVDRIALSGGTKRDGLPRVRAAIRHVLDEATKAGHCFLPGREVGGQVRKLIGAVAGEIITKAGKNLLSREEIVVRKMLDGKDNAVFLAEIEKQEKAVGDWLHDRICEEPAEYKTWWAEGSGVPLDEVQSKAVDYAAASLPLLVITGGPGTGKTTITRSIVSACEFKKESVVLCSPTGKAAKRLAEQSGRDAKTIHRTLGWNPAEGKWSHNRDFPLDCDVVIVDEASMVDLPLFMALTCAIRPTTRLVLVGDVAQLPPVGHGNILADVIAADVCPVVKLEKVYRQSEHSWVAENSKRVRQGTPPVRDPNASDFFFVMEDDADEARARLLQLCQKVIPERHGVDPVRDVHVLAPQRKGRLGIEVLNDALQPLMNPEPPHATIIKARGRTFRASDKVRQTRNNYDLMVMNGEVGVITEAHLVSSEKAKRPHVCVDYGDRSVWYDSEADLGDLVLNFAGTVHSSQGSEFPIVVAVCHSYNAFMLSRNLLYTAMTRAQQAVYLVGDERGLQLALKNTKVSRRYTQLADRAKKGSHYGNTEQDPKETDQQEGNGTQEAV
jgi:exodeoxyribonuclease V alpha subunit